MTVTVTALATVTTGSRVSCPGTSNGKGALSVTVNTVLPPILGVTAQRQITCSPARTARSSDVLATMRQSRSAVRLATSRVGVSTMVSPAPPTSSPPTRRRTSVPATSDGPMSRTTSTGSPRLAGDGTSNAPAPARRPRTMNRSIELGSSKSRGSRKCRTGGPERLPNSGSRPSVRMGDTGPNRKNTSRAMTATSSPASRACLVTPRAPT